VASETRSTTGASRDRGASGQLPIAVSHPGKVFWPAEGYTKIAVHVMASRASSPRQPDWVCFDLDPESEMFQDAARAGLHVKAALDIYRETTGKSER